MPIQIPIFPGTRVDLQAGSPANLPQYDYIGAALQKLGHAGGKGERDHEGKVRGRSRSRGVGEIYDYDPGDQGGPGGEQGEITSPDQMLNDQERAEYWTDVNGKQAQQLQDYQYAQKFTQTSTDFESDKAQILQGFDPNDPDSIGDLPKNFSAAAKLRYGAFYEGLPDRLKEQYGQGFVEQQEASFRDAGAELEYKHRNEVFTAAGGKFDQMTGGAVQQIKQLPDLHESLLENISYMIKATTRFTTETQRTAALVSATKLIGDTAIEAYVAKKDYASAAKIADDYGARLTQLSPPSRKNLDDNDIGMTSPIGRQSDAGALGGGAPKRVAEINDYSQKAGWNFGHGRMSKVEGMIIHHTAGQERDPQALVNVLKQRGLSVQFMIGRDGTIHQFMPEGARAYHMGPGSGSMGSGRSNDNMQGVEVVARNEADVTPAQRDAISRLVQQQSSRYGYDPAKAVFGHGEVNPGHKQADEGATAKKIRDGWQAAHLDQPGPADDAMAQARDGGEGTTREGADGAPPPRRAPLVNPPDPLYDQIWADKWEEWMQKNDANPEDLAEADGRGPMFMQGPFNEVEREVRREYQRRGIPYPDHPVQNFDENSHDFNKQIPPFRAPRSPRSELPSNNIDAAADDFAQGNEAQTTQGTQLFKPPRYEPPQMRQLQSKPPVEQSAAAWDQTTREQVFASVPRDLPFNASPNQVQALTERLRDAALEHFRQQTGRDAQTDQDFEIIGDAIHSEMVNRGFTSRGDRPPLNETREEYPNNEEWMPFFERQPADVQKKITDLQRDISLDMSGATERFWKFMDPLVKEWRKDHPAYEDPGQKDLDRRREPGPIMPEGPYTPKPRGELPGTILAQYKSDAPQSSLRLKSNGTDLEQRLGRAAKKHDFDETRDYSDMTSNDWSRMGTAMAIKGEMGEDERVAERKALQTMIVTQVTGQHPKFGNYWTPTPMAKMREHLIERGVPENMVDELIDTAPDADPTFKKFRVKWGEVHAPWAEFGTKHGRGWQPAPRKRGTVLAPDGTADDVTEDYDHQKDIVQRTDMDTELRRAPTDENGEWAKEDTGAEDTEHRRRPTPTTGWSVEDLMKTPEFVQELKEYVDRMEKSGAQREQHDRFSGSNFGGGERIVPPESLFADKEYQQGVTRQSIIANFLSETMNRRFYDQFKRDMNPAERNRADEEIDRYMLEKLGEETEGSIVKDLRRKLPIETDPEWQKASNDGRRNLGPMNPPKGWNPPDPIGENPGSPHASFGAVVDLAMALIGGRGRNPMAGRGKANFPTQETIAAEKQGISEFSAQVRARDEAELRRKTQEAIDAYNQRRGQQGKDKASMNEIISAIEETAGKSDLAPSTGTRLAPVRRLTEREMRAIENRIDDKKTLAELTPTELHVLERAWKKHEGWSGAELPPVDMPFIKPEIRAQRLVESFLHNAKGDKDAAYLALDRYRAYSRIKDVRGPSYYDAVAAMKLLEPDVNYTTRPFGSRSKIPPLKNAR